MKRMALAAALLGLAILGLVVWRTEPLRSHASSDPPVVRADGSEDVQAATEFVEATPTAEASRVPASVSPAPPRSDPRSATRYRDVSKVHLSGTIAAFDEQRVAHNAEDGSFRLATTRVRGFVGSDSPTPRSSSSCARASGAWTFRAHGSDPPPASPWIAASFGTASCGIASPR